MRPEDTELAALLGQFVPVRIVNFKNVDMNLFRFDYDLTFAALMMHPDGTTYSRFGTQDERASTARMSIAGLKNVMRAVLEQHQRLPRATSILTRKRFTLADIPAYARSKAAKEACAHCHYANNFRLEQLRSEGKFRRELLFQYPHPENIGITLSVDSNNIVEAVAPDSPAQRAGVRPGDTILRAEQTPVYTAADLQFALNDIPDAGKVILTLRRNGKPLSPVMLNLPTGWRRTDISWRASQGDMPPTIGFWAEPLNAAQKKTAGIAPGGLALRVTFLFPGDHWAKTRNGLREGDIVTGVDGKLLPHLTMRQFHSQFRLTHNVGETATLQLQRDGKPMDLTVPCLENEAAP